MCARLWLRLSHKYLICPNGVRTNVNDFTVNAYTHRHTSDTHIVSSELSADIIICLRRKRARKGAKTMTETTTTTMTSGERKYYDCWLFFNDWRERKTKSKIEIMEHRKSVVSASGCQPTPSTSASTVLCKAYVWCIRSFVASVNVDSLSSDDREKEKITEMNKWHRRISGKEVEVINTLLGCVGMPDGPVTEGHYKQEERPWYSSYWL